MAAGKLHSVKPQSEIMKRTIKIPRILKIEAVKGLELRCIFNNGETRAIDFKQLFSKWNISPEDPEYILLDPKEFRKVRLRNQTLSWKNVAISLTDMEGKEVIQPYELSPDVVYAHSQLIAPGNKYRFGAIIRKNRLAKGLSQQELAVLSGTSKTYISRLENDQIEPELSTLSKIVELGLGKKVKVEIA
jgi:DNA-binding XRE family transcriptional regulator